MTLKFELTVREATALMACLEHCFRDDAAMLEIVPNRRWIRAADRAHAKLRDVINEVNGFLQ